MLELLSEIQPFTVILFSRRLLFHEPETNHILFSENKI